MPITKPFKQRNDIAVIKAAFHQLAIDISLAVAHIGIGIQHHTSTFLQKTHECLMKISHHIHIMVINIKPAHCLCDRYRKKTWR